MTITLKLDSTNSNESLDVQKVSGARIGHLTWQLKQLKAAHMSSIKNSTSLPLHQASQQMSSPVTSTSSNQLHKPASLTDDQFVEFRYYSGVKVLARSVQLRLVISNSSILPRNILNAAGRPYTPPSDEFITFRIHGLFCLIDFFKVVFLKF